MADNNSNTKAKYWLGVLYTENMCENWRDEIEGRLQVPFSYCVHDKDINENGELAKEHVHICIAFNNTTTYKYAFSVLDSLSKENAHCLNKIERAINIRYAYDYLIHDTDACKKKNKHLYEKSERICCNNFDVSAYEQLSTADKNKMTKELCDIIVQNCYDNFADFYVYVTTNYSIEYFEILRVNSGLFERLTRGIYYRVNAKR